MPKLSNEQAIATAIRFMRDGRVQDADDLLTAHARELAEAEGRPYLAPAPPPPPRARDLLLLEFAHQIYELMGSPGALKPLLDELDASFAAATSAEAVG